MSNELRELAKQLMALPGFRWWDGMSNTEGGICLYDGGGGVTQWAIIDEDKCWLSAWAEIDDSDIMDLGDRGTQGCVMAWCEEVFGAEFSVTWRSGRSGKPRGFNARWYEDGELKSHICGYTTKVEAMARALIERLGSKGKAS